MIPVLLLAVVVGAGRVPIPKSVTAFPDPTPFTGVGSHQEATMVTTVLADAGGALRSAGPGPQQLLARWQAGQLNPAERMVVLLGGASFHDPALLPMYAAELRSPERRLREAAAVGLYALIGDPGRCTPTPRRWWR